MDFAEFVLSKLPEPPARVLEVGCGEDGGLVEPLAAVGYDALGIDPHAPEGPRFRRIRLEELEEPARFDAVVAARVLHHVHPLRDGLAKLARLAPLLLVWEFARERIDAATQGWYESQHRLLRAAGATPSGPPDLDEWRVRHPDVLGSDVVLAALAERFDELDCRRGAYLYRWLDGPASRELEESLIAAGAIQPIGVIYAGATRSRR